jgi:hypothetical protein
MVFTLTTCRDFLRCGRPLDPGAAHVYISGSIVLVVQSIISHLRPSQLTGHLCFDFLADSGFNSLVFFFGNLFSHLSVGWVSAKNVGVDYCHDNESNGNNLTEQRAVRPGDGCQKYVKQETPDTVEQETKVNGNHDAKEFELSFQAANQETSTSGING